MRVSSLLAPVLALALLVPGGAAHAQQSSPAGAASPGAPSAQPTQGATSTPAATPGADEKPVPAPGAKPINTMCPILTDEESVPKYTVSWRGVNIGLCCAKCQKKFLANPTAYLAHLPPLPAAAQPAAAMAPTGAAAAAPASPAPHEGEHAEGSLEELFGRFHVLIVHFPIALLLAGALAALLGAARRSTGLAAAAHYCVNIAALMAPITALSGIERAEGYSPLPGLEQTLEWHRYGGITTAALAVVLAIIGWRARRSGAGSGAARAFTWGLVLAALIVGLTGHFGGQLVHGAGYPFEQ